MLQPFLLAMGPFLGQLALAQTYKVHDMERPLPPVVASVPEPSTPAPIDALILFDGKDLSHWRHANNEVPGWTIQNGELVITPGSGNLETRETLDDVHLHIEWMVPESLGDKEGQGRGNSGVFLMGLYEIQVLESLGGTTYADGMAGAMYGQYPPLVNAGAGIGRWNSYDIFFRSPRFEDSQMVQPATVTVFHNGHTLHAVRAFQGVTRHKVETQYHLHAPKLPLALQDHSDPIHFRNIWVRPLPDWAARPKTNVAGRLRQHVEVLAGMQPARNAKNPTGMRLAVEYIAEQMRRAGIAVHFQDFEANGQVYCNVIGRVGPAEGPTMVVGAHYDCAGETPGADDNASGVAALLELGQELAGRQLVQPLELVAYALEEPPYFGTDSMGSVVHAKSLQAAGTKVQGMVALEMLGYFSDRPKSQRYPIAGMEASYPSTGDFIAVVTRPDHAEWLGSFATAMRSGMTLGVETLAAPAVVTGIDFSDHRSYWAAGFPALMVTDTAFYRNPHYHESTDTPETLDYERMGQVVKGLLAALAPPPTK